MDGAKPRKVLQIVEGAYRVTVEEQDDPALWIINAMRGAGAELTTLLRGNAVNYAVRSQDAAGLVIGSWRQTQPPRPAEDVTKLMAKGVPVYVVDEDIAERGLERGDLVPGLQSIARAGIAGLVAGFDQVWHW